MSGTAKVKPPKNNAEWARNTEKRLTQNEHPTAQRVGDWVLSTHPDSGALIASNVNGGSVILASRPAAGDNADELATQGQPFIKVSRQATQNEPAGAVALVQWDSLIYQTDEWGFVPTGSDIVIPADGIYYCQYHLSFTAAAYPIKALFLIDTVARMVQEFSSGTGTIHMAEPFPLNAGQLISCGAFGAGGGTFDISAAVGDPNAYTSMSLLKLAVD